QASRDSLAQLHTELKPSLSAGGVELGAELFAALKVSEEKGALRRTVTEPTVEANRRQDIIGKIYAKMVSAEAVKVLQGVAGTRWSTEREFGDAVEYLAATAVVHSAEHNGLAGLDSLTQQLLAFNHAVEANLELQRALTDRQAPVSAHGELTVSLITADAMDEAKVFVRQAVELHSGIKPFGLL